MRILDSNGNLRRGVLGTAIRTESDPLYVYATHLDNPDDADEIRLEQVNQLLDDVADASPAIIGGDFNATPDSDVIAAVLAAGFVDTGTLLPEGATTSENGRRIDYIFVRGHTAVRSTSVIDVWASDHRPVVTRLSFS
jgi:endonuclease/exonuclease/phosphatase (EEP) superfamily protein YafD